MENTKELIKEVTNNINRKSGLLRADRTNKLQQYIDSIMSEIESEIRVRKYPLLPRFFGEICNILNHLKSQVNTFNDDELRQLATDAMTDLEALYQQEGNYYDGLKHVGENNRERVNDKKNYTKNKNENNRNYMDYVKEAIEQINREFQKHKTIRLTPLQITGLSDLLNQVSRNLLVSIQEIHDEGIHIEGTLIKGEIEQLLQREHETEGRNQRVLGNPFALEHYGEDTEEFNKKAIQMAKKISQNPSKSEESFGKALPDNILE